MQGNPAHLEFFVTGFSLTGNVVKQTGLMFVLMCVFFNIINVRMEEGLFRGFFMTYLRELALLLPAFLFGIRHLVTTLRSLLDGEMTSFFAVLIFICCKKRSARRSAQAS